MLAALAVVAVSAPVSWAQAEIKVGAVLSITGPVAFMGEPQERTLKMDIEKINAEGGVLGQPLNLTIYDDGADASKARTFAQRLIQDDKVSSILGVTLTGPSMALYPIAENAKVPVFTLAGAIQLVEPIKKWMFKIGHTDRQACSVLFQDMKSRGIERVGLISGNDSFGNSMRTQCLGMVDEYGIKIVADERYGPRDSDMTPQLVNIKNAPGLQAVLSPGHGESATILTRNYRQLGFTQPLYQSHGVASHGYVSATGAAAEGVRVPAPAILIADQLPEDNPQRAVALDYAKRYQERFNEPAGFFGAAAADALRLFVAAAEKAGSTDPEKIRAAAEQLGPVVGAAGIYNLTDTDHLGLDTSTFYMSEVHDGKWRLLGPDE